MVKATVPLCHRASHPWREKGSVSAELVFYLNCNSGQYMTPNKSQCSMSISEHPGKGWSFSAQQVPRPPHSTPRATGVKTFQDPPSSSSPSSARRSQTLASGRGKAVAGSLRTAEAQGTGACDTVQIQPHYIQMRPGKAGDSAPAQDLILAGTFPHPGLNERQRHPGDKSALEAEQGTLYLCTRLLMYKMTVV